MCDDDHNPLMLAATALDVRYRLILNLVQLESAKKLLMEQVSAWGDLHYSTLSMTFVISY